MVVSDITYLVLACYGLAALAEHWHAAFLVVRLVGACYLVYLGVRLWRSSRHQLHGGFGAVDKSGRSFLQGFVISASNPKVILFYIAFLPTFMDLTVLSRGDVALAALLAFVGLMLGLMLVACGASSARRYLDSPRGCQALNRTAGAVIICAGAFLASSG